MWINPVSQLSRVGGVAVGPAGIAPSLADLHPVSETEEEDDVCTPGMNTWSAHVGKSICSKLTEIHLEKLLKFMTVLSPTICAKIWNKNGWIGPIRWSCEVLVSSINRLLCFVFWPGGAKPRFDSTCKLYELDPCDGYGKVCLVYKGCKIGMDICLLC